MARKQQELKRKKSEVCDYCFANRVAMRAHRFNNHGDLHTYRPLDTNIFPCICDQGFTCLDYSCAHASNAKDS